jgi:hypothetical protein
MSSENSIIRVNGKEVSSEEFQKLKEDKTVRLRLREDSNDSQDYKVLKRDDKL